ncbi:hypothetical protein FDZ84_01075 [Saccharopolyspora sp. ASAGF58]|nr:hypothetical protein FDZ84_01075 [Saccharopolyspora sp. ASAGF58]
MEDQDRWAKTVTSQHDVVGVGQLRDFGLSRHVIQAQVEAQRWRRVLPGVYSLFTGPLPRSSLISAALLYGGAWALLSHRTAAEEWGMFPVSADSPVHITLPYKQSSVSQPPLVQVHRSRAFNYIVAPSEPPRTNREDTIMDLAAAEPSEDAARNLFIDLVGSNRIDLRRIHDQLEKRPPFRYRGVMRHALDLLTGGALSALEAEYVLKVEQAHGLPSGRRQVPFVVDGIRLWEDVTYDDHEVRLTVRLDGRQFHSTSRIAFRDRRRDNAAELANRSRLVYGWHEVHHDPCGVAVEVRRVLEREGWSGSGESCRDCG